VNRCAFAAAVPARSNAPPDDRGAVPRSLGREGLRDGPRAAPRRPLVPGSDRHVRARRRLFEALRRLAATVEGVRVDQIVADGDDVVVLHELTTPKGRAPVAEWYRVRGDKIGEVRVYFDARSFAPPA
jgi:hypothetical protein